MSILGNTALAKTPSKDEADCLEVIKVADKALKEKQDVIEQDQRTIASLKESNSELRNEKEETEADLSSPIHNPLLMAGIGATAGVLVGGPIAIGVGLLGGLIFHF